MVLNGHQVEVLRLAVIAISGKHATRSGRCCGGGPKAQTVVIAITAIAMKVLHIST